MNKSFLVFSYLLFFASCKSQEHNIIPIEECNYGIKLLDFNRISDFQHAPDISIKKLGEAGYVVIKLHDCRGVLGFKGYRLDSSLFIQGQYLSAPDTSIIYSTSLNPVTLQEKIIQKKYFSPIRDGVFYYWENRVLLGEEEYDKGILINKKEFSKSE